MSYISEAQAKKMICDASRSIRLCTAVTVNGVSLTKDKKLYDLIVALNGLSGGSGTFTTLSGDVVSTSTGGATTIQTGVVSNAKLATVPTATVKGRVAAGTGVPTDLTGTQLTTLVDVFTTSLKGAVNPPTTATGKFLRDDNSWQTVSGGSGGYTTYAVTVTGSAGITCFVTGTTGITVAKTNSSTITFTIPASGILDTYQISYPSGENPGANATYVFNYTSNTVTNQGNTTSNPPNVNGWFTSGVPTDVYTSGSIGSSSVFVRTITTVGSGNITMTYTFGSTGLATGAIALKGWF